MHNNRSKGFTLIELLVVIAIIGVLSAVVLASLNTARTRGNNAAVQSNLAGILSQAEIYYGNNTNSYGTFAWTAVDGQCAAAATGMPSDTTVQRAIQAADNANGTGVIGCVATPTTYVIAADLVGGGYWCVDYTGVSKSVGAGVPATTVTAAGALAVCP